MVRRMTPSQYQNYVRQQQNKLKQQVRRVNQDIDRLNRENKRAVDNYNREVRRVNNHNKAAVAKYNQSVRTHNSRVESQRRQRVRALQSMSGGTYTSVRISSVNLNSSYDLLAGRQGHVAYDDLLALSEREAANSAEVAQALVSDEPAAPEQVEESGLIDYLSDFSEDLCDRWRGALYSLNPTNPDAARHFCTSAREILTEILSKWAPDKEVLESDPNCELTPNKSGPSRRSKIKYFLRQKGADTPEMLGFVDQDIDDVLQLFHVFNEATHGAAGKHGFRKLLTIKKRVEGSIMFLASVAV